MLLDLQLRQDNIRQHNLSTFFEKIDIVLGHSKLNTNRVTIKTGVTVDSSFSAISFSAKYLREILVANKEAKNGVLEISSKGLARVTFSVDSINSKYFLVKIDTAD